MIKTGLQEVAATAPDDLQLIANALHIISSSSGGRGGGVMPTGHVNRRDIGRRVGGVGVRVLVEGVVSKGGAMRAEVIRRLRLGATGRVDQRVADDRLRVGTAGPRAAGLVRQVALWREEFTVYS